MYIISFTELFISNFIMAFIFGLLLEFIYLRWGGMARWESLKSMNLSLLLMVATFVVLVLRANTLVPIDVSLSLKVLGILSVIRFYAFAIKPEELAYSFLAMTVGGALGLSELTVLISSFMLIGLFIIMRHTIYNIWVTWRNKWLLNSAKLTIQTSHPYREVRQLVNQHCLTVRLLNLQETPGSTTSVYQIGLKSFTQFKGLREALRKIDPQVQLLLDMQLPKEETPLVLRLDDLD